MQNNITFCILKALTTVKYFLMNKEINVSIRLLKDKIQNKFGRSIFYAHDCEELSELIKVQTRRQVSSSTLKRFFGIIKSPFNLSIYTLDTLSIFLQFENWQEFLNNFEKQKQKSSRTEIWDQLKKGMDIITTTSLKSIKSKIGTRLEYFPIRSFAEKKFDLFLSSPQIATAFIAPDGYGKSTIVSQLTEKFFTGEQAIYPNDIVCVVDGYNMYKLIVHHQNIKQVYNEIEFDSEKSFSDFLNSNSQLVKGRFVLIIDGIDDIFAETDNSDYHIQNLLNIISVHENTKWFKILITCSPKIWRLFSYRMQKNHLLKSLWFDVAFQGADEELINIPSLKRSEIKLILEKNHYPISLDDLCFNYPCILDILNNPYLLHLFLLSDKPAGSISDIDLLNQYIKNTILAPPYSDEKYSILKSYFVLCAHGKKSIEIRKKDLKLSPSMTIAYNTLLRTGILFEYTVQDTSISMDNYVKFSRNILFTHYLTNILIDENKLNIDFLRRLIIEYKNTPELQVKILSHIIRILFKDEQTDLLKEIFSILDTDKLPEEITTFNMLSSAITYVIGIEMRKNQNLGNILIPYYAQSAIARTLYFEKYFDIDRLVLYSGNDLDYYLRYSQSEGAKLYVHFMKFTQYFLSENTELCTREHENILSLGLKEEKNVFNASFYYIPQVIFQSVYLKKLEPKLMAEIYQVSGILFSEGIQTTCDIPNFEFAVIFALNFGKMNKEIIDLAHHIYETYDLTNLTSSCFYQLFLSVYAKALLETGETMIGVDLFNQVKPRNLNFPENMKYFYHLRYMLIETEFLVYNRKLIKAHQELEKIKDISHMLRFNYLYNCASDLDKNINTIL